MIRRWKWLLGLGVILLGGFLVSVAVRGGADRNRKPSLEAKVEARRFVTNVLATGTVKPRVGAQVNVGARVSGKVEKLNARIGAHVKKGEILAIIEHRDLLSQIAQKTAQLDSVKSQISAEESKGKAELARASSTIAERQAEVETEKSRLDLVRSQLGLALAVEEKRLELVKQQRQSELNMAEAALKEYSATFDFARKDLGRMKPLFEKGMLAEQNLDRADADLKSADSRLKSSQEQKALARVKLLQEVAVQEELVGQARADFEKQATLQEAVLKKSEAALAVAEMDLNSIAASSEAAIAVLKSKLPQLEAELEESKIRLNYATIVAPIDGVVGTISTQEGETVAAGFNSPTFVTVVDLNQLQVDAYVDEVDIGKVKPGQKAVFTVDAYPSTEFKGTVLAVYPSAILQDNVVYYDVVVGIETDYAGRLRPEMTVNVTIGISSRDNVPAIPLRALKRQAGSVTVNVSADGRLEQREVKTGMEDGEFVEVLSGVKPGETVVYEEPVKVKWAPPGGRH